MVDGNSNRENLLPYDGTVHYFERVFSPKESTLYMHHLLSEVRWKNDEANIFGRHIITKRKAAWYGDKPFNYKYSKITKTALPWTNELLDLKIYC